MSIDGTSKTGLDDDQIAWLMGLPMSKRAAVVRDHILEHGAITTQELSDVYGYGHPPRAKRDLIDAGAGVDAKMITVDGKRMAQYFFTGAADKNGAGRVVIPKAFADGLKDAYDNHCAICSGEFAARELQSDHRVPFAIGGDKPEMVYDDFMPLCASDNRAKSWSCEHCANWTIKDVSTCEGCFWAHPEDYDHVAMQPERRLSMVFQGEEVEQYDLLHDIALASNVTVNVAAKKKLFK